MKKTTIKIVEKINLVTKRKCDVVFSKNKTIKFLINANFPNL